jgi:predicted small lipoprotein YifL
MHLVLLLLLAACLTGCGLQYPYYCEDENAPICYLQRRPIFAPREKATSDPKPERRDGANAIQGKLEALRGCRRLRPADPCRRTDHLAESIAPSCHERPSGGLGSRVGPFDANVGTLYRFFGGMVSQVRVWPKRTPALCQCWGDGGGNDIGCGWPKEWFVYGRFRQARGVGLFVPGFSSCPPSHRQNIDVSPDKKHASLRLRREGRGLPTL